MSDRTNDDETPSPDAQGATGNGEGGADTSGSGNILAGAQPSEHDDADTGARPEQPPMDDDASGLPDDDAEKLGDFA